MTTSRPPAAHWHHPDRCKNATRRAKTHLKVGPLLARGTSLVRCALCRICPEEEAAGDDSLPNVVAPPEGEGVAGLEVVGGVVTEHGYGQLDTVICRPQRLAIGSCDEGAEDLGAVGFMVVCPDYDTAARFRQGQVGALAASGRFQLDEGTVFVVLHLPHHPV